jgi:putative intracellular protease/amidase
MYDRLGWDVTLAGVTDVVQPCNSGLPPITVDVLIDDIPSAEPYDCIAIWPSRWQLSNPYGDLIASAHAIELIQQANAAGKVLWCTCAGLRVFAAADIINGVQVQGRPGQRQRVFARVPRRRGHLPGPGAAAGHRRQHRNHHARAELLSNQQRGQPHGLSVSSSGR